MSTCHCGRTKANHEPSMHRFTARPQVKETTMPNPATEPTTEAGRRLLGLDMGPVADYWVNLGANEMRFAILAIEQEAAAGSALDPNAMTEAEHAVRRRLRKRDPESCLWMDSPAEHVADLLAEYAALTDSRP